MKYKYTRATDGKYTIWEDNHRYMTVSSKRLAEDFCANANRNESAIRLKNQISGFIDHMIANFFIGIFTWVTLVYFETGVAYAFVHVTCQFLVFLILSVLQMIFKD